MTDLRILLVEDDPLDAELLIRELQKHGFDPEWERVDTPEGFIHRLAQDPPDVIIADHAMPQFSSAGALQCLHESGLTIPFIVVSHAIGEEEAVKLMRNGAADYLMKDRLGRIGEAVRHALESQYLREEHAAAQQGMEERTSALVSSHHALQALASELTLAEQRERKRLAAELHDHLGPDAGAGADEDGPTPFEARCRAGRVAAGARDRRVARQSVDVYPLAHGRIESVRAG
jgi:DNA-binding NtrC family response regulator